jgi:hypothetical protein
MSSILSMIYVFKLFYTLMKNVFIFSLILSLLACNKEVTQLPDATDTGSNTFGARIDTTFWTPKGFGPVATAPILEARYEEGRTVVINARNFAGQPKETEFEIYLYHVTTPGTYLLNATTPKYPRQNANYAYYVERRITPINEWITTSEYTGSVTVTKADTVNRIIAGTFQFRAINSFGTPQPINVTEGRFDIKIP